nr:MAG TPA: hypothetical protein [Caudoviricetes sp.]
MSKISFLRSFVKHYFIPQVCFFLTHLLCRALIGSRR